MIFGLTWDKLLLIGLLAAIIIGPERLPGLAEGFARLVHRGGRYLRGARERLRDEMGTDVDEVDWRKLDPRQYDPRRIIRDALFDEPSPAATGVAASAAAAEPHAPGASRQAPRPFDAEQPTPYDDEAT